MKLRRILSWLLAIPAILLLIWFLIAVAAVFLLPGVTQPLLLIAGCFLYLLVAHAFYFGSYFAHPPLYGGKLHFLTRLFHSRRSLPVWIAVYGAAFAYLFYGIYFVHRHAIRPASSHTPRPGAPGIAELAIVQ